MREVRTALKYDKRIIPCVVDDVDSGWYWNGWPDTLPNDVSCITDEQVFRLKVDSHFGHSILDLMKSCNKIISDYNSTLIRDYNNKHSSQHEQNKGIESFSVRGVSFNMIYVKGGAFLMGATEEHVGIATEREYPAHLVTLSDYYIAQTPVTQELWQAVMGNNPSVNIGNNQRPVELVNWYDCQDFISKLNQLTGKCFRLPTEAEWEFAARGGIYTHGYMYSGSNNSDEVAWHESNSNQTSHPVASKMPNELGLYDMSGNVWEWCNDFYETYTSEPMNNPTGPIFGNQKVMRGGSYFSTLDYGRVSNRFSPPSPLFKAHPLGFRLVMETND